MFSEKYFISYFISTTVLLSNPFVWLTFSTWPAILKGKCSSASAFLGGFLMRSTDFPD